MRITFHHQCPYCKYNKITRISRLFWMRWIPRSKYFMCKDCEKTFIQEALDNDLGGLKGHRSVGGCRASIYNATPLETVEALTDFMKEFERKKG